MAPSPTAVGTADWYKSLWKMDCAVEVKMCFACIPAVPLLVNFMPRTYIHENVQSSSVYNYAMLEPTQMSTEKNIVLSSNVNFINTM